MGMYMVNARQAKNLSQSEVARLCDMTRQYYGQLELGKRELNFHWQPQSVYQKFWIFHLMFSLKMKL